MGRGKVTTAGLLAATAAVVSHYVKVRVKFVREEPSTASEDRVFSKSQLSRWFASDVSLGNKDLSDCLEEFLELSPISSDVYKMEMKDSNERINALGNLHLLVNLYSQFICGAVPLIQRQFLDQYRETADATPENEMIIAHQVHHSVFAQTMQSFVSSLIYMGFLQRTDQEIGLQNE